MEHGDTAQIAAVVGAAGAPLVLLGRTRLVLLAGLLLLAVAELGLARALVPSADVRALVERPLVLAALAGGGVVALAAAAALARFPAAVSLVVVAAAPFRVPVELGDERAFLLLPLYGVLGVAVLAIGWRALRGDVLPTLPAALGVPAALVVGLAGVSLVWTRDLHAGAIALAFFFFPFAVLVAVVARSPLPQRAGRAFAALVVALASLFAVVGLWQARTKELFFAPDLEVANAYTSFFRVTSLFKDPSLYGRYLVIAIAVLLVALWLGRIRLELAALLVGFLFAGLYFSYSQSSFVALFAVVLAVPLVLGDRRVRLTLVAAAFVFAAVGSAVAMSAASGHSLRDATSGRSRLVERTVAVIEEHPVAGVGIGSQPRASAHEAGSESVRRNASHTTPLTVAAELGVLGLAAYAAFLAGVAWLLLATARVDRPLGVGLAAVFCVLVVHSLFYSGFFEDPVTWAVPAVAAAFLAERGRALEVVRGGGERQSAAPRPAVAGAQPTRG